MNKTQENNISAPTVFIGNYFIHRLYDILEDASYSHIVSWTTEGDGIHIKDCDLFMEQIVPKYFKHSKISSFFRQMNMYYFKLVKSIKPNGKLFTNPQFIRGKRELLNQIPHRMQEYRRNAKLRMKMAQK